MSYIPDAQILRKSINEDLLYRQRRRTRKIELRPPYTQDDIDMHYDEEHIKLPSDLIWYLTNVSREIVTSRSRKIFPLRRMTWLKNIDNYEKALVNNINYKINYNGYNAYAEEYPTEAKSRCVGYIKPIYTRIIPMSLFDDENEDEDDYANDTDEDYVYGGYDYNNRCEFTFLSSMFEIGLSGDNDCISMHIGNTDAYGKIFTYSENVGIWRIESDDAKTIDGQYISPFMHFIMNMCKVHRKIIQFDQQLHDGVVVTSAINFLLLMSGQPILRYSD